MNDLRLVKRLGGDRVGGYAVLWGDPARKDVTGEFFTPRTEELDTVFKSMGALPYFYQHAGDDALKATVVGRVDVMTPDDVGLWYEAQLSLAGAYRSRINEMLEAGLLGTSSGVLPLARKANRRTGEIMRWPIMELSATPTPAEWRMLERPVAELKSAYEALGLRWPASTGSAGDEAKVANLADWLESRLHREFTVMADDLLGDGVLTREERIALSGLIGDALEVFHAGLQDAVLAGVRERSPWQEAPSPPAPLPMGEGSIGKNVPPAEEPGRGAEDARSAKDGRADSGTGSVTDRPEQGQNGDAGEGPAREIDFELERLALLEV